MMIDALADNRPRRRILMVAWLASLVLVALVTAVLTHWLWPHEMADETIRRDPLAVDATVSPVNRPSSDDSSADQASGVVTSSPDTIIEWPADDSPGSSGEAASQVDEAVSSPELALTPASGLAPMATAGPSTRPNNSVTQSSNN